MPDDGVIAVHEAGHALMAVALNLALAHVQVGDNPRYDLADGPDCTSPARRLDRVRVLMGGGAAEEVVFDRQPIGTGSDDQQIADLLGPDDHEVALRDEVRRFLALNQGTLRYVAARLARRGMLSGDEVEALVRPRRRSHRPVMQPGAAGAMK
jgi:hypothetical protein